MLRLVAVFVCACVVSLAVSGQAAASDDALRREIEDLKKGQEAIQKDLQEIKRLLTNPSQAAAPRPAAAPALPATIDIAKEPIRGNERARIAVIEYSDYECPFCARYVANTYPEIDREYVKTGKIRYVFRDLPLSFHKQAFKAAEASHCAGEQGKFWEMHDRMFQNSKELTLTDLPRHAGAVGLDVPQFQQCLDSGRFATAVTSDVTHANGIGITGTPTFVIGVIEPNSSVVKVRTKLVGARSYADFKAAIDAVASSSD